VQFVTSALVVSGRRWLRLSADHDDVVRQAPPTASRPQREGLSAGWAVSTGRRRRRRTGPGAWTGGAVPQLWRWISPQTWVFPTCN